MGLPTVGFTLVGFAGSPDGDVLDGRSREQLATVFRSP